MAENRTVITPVTMNTPGPSYDWDATGLSGAQRDAARALTELFQSYGIGSLASVIVGYMREGYSADTVSILLQESDAYKKRFAANERRRQLGLPVLTPQEYLATERSYRQIMQSAGLPPGFYDRPEDFQSFLERDVAPTEVQSRIEAARDFINNQVDSNTRAAFSEFYSEGDMIAFALDADRAAPLVGRAFEAARIAGQAQNQGIGIDRLEAESLADLGVDRQTAAQGFSVIAAEKDNAQKLAAIDGEELTVDDLIDETFRADADAAKKRQRLGQREAARFGGSSGVGGGSLSTGRGGSL